MLTLSGTASLAAYQAELDAVTFASLSAGNRTINCLVNDGIAASALVSSNVPVFATNSDLDILMQNTSSGQVSVWEMNGNNVIGGGAVTFNPGPAWKAVGTGDFYDKGDSDVP